MPYAELEYLGGPLDGRRDQALVRPGQPPEPIRLVEVEARYASVFDSEPSVPKEAHWYRRTGEQPDNEIWRYAWDGKLR